MAFCDQQQQISNVKDRKQAISQPPTLTNLRWNAGSNTDIEVLLFFFVKPEAGWGCILINSLNAKHFSSEPQNMIVDYNIFYDYCYYLKLTKPLSEKGYASHLVLWLLYKWVTPCRAGLGGNESGGCSSHCCHSCFDIWSECISVHATLVKCQTNDSSWSPAPSEG